MSEAKRALQQDSKRRRDVTQLVTESVLDSWERHIASCIASSDPSANNGGPKQPLVGELHRLAQRIRHASPCPITKRKIKQQMVATLMCRARCYLQGHEEARSIPLHAYRIISENVYNNSKSSIWLGVW